MEINANGFLLLVTARQRHDVHDTGMADEVGVGVAVLRESELKHDQVTGRQVVEPCKDGSRNR
jgi:hypothetical protein